MKHLLRSTISTINGDGEVLGVVGAVQNVRIVYAVEIRAVGRLYIHRYQTYGTYVHSLMAQAAGPMISAVP